MAYLPIHNALPYSLKRQGVFEKAEKDTASLVRRVIQFSHKDQPFNRGQTSSCL